MDAGRTLRDARRRAGLSQAALAARAGTSQATLSAYETRRKSPTVETFTRLLAAAGARLTVTAATGSVRAPTDAENAQTARRLRDVLALAAALPSSPPRELAFPRLPPAAR